MKKNSIFKVVLLVILCVTVCTWIFKGISFTGQLSEGEVNQVGVFDLASYTLDLFRYFPYILISVLSIGAFYGVAYRIPAYRVLLDTIVEKFKGKENIFLVATIILISVIVSVTGLSIGMLFVFPFIISIVLLMGYNKLVATSVTAGSVMIGLAGTTLGTASISYVNAILGTNTTDWIIAKIFFLLLGIVLLAAHVITYSMKTKNNTDKVLANVPAENDVVIKVETAKVSKTKSGSKKVETAKVSKTKSGSKKVEKKTADKKKTETKKTASKSTTKATTVKKKAPAKKTSAKRTRANDSKNGSVKVVKNNNIQTIIPFIVLFDLALIIIALGTFDWSGVANAKWPSEVLTSIRDFKIFGFPILSKILGSTENLSAFGGWGLSVEIPATIIIITCLLAFIYGVKFDKFIEGIVDGMKKAFMPAFIMFLTYLVLIIVTYHPFQLHITKFLLTTIKGFNVVTMSIVAMFASLLNVDSIYAAQSTLPYVSSLVNTTKYANLIAVIWQAIYGITMLIAPTSVILIGTLSYLEIPYTQWIKHIWKLFFELLVAAIVIFFIAAIFFV